MLVSRDKLKFFRLRHPSNIDSISVTLDVSKLSRFIELNDTHPLNIAHIISTLDVLNFGKYNEVNFSQFSNIPLKLFVKLLLKLSPVIKLLNLIQL